MPSEDSNQPQPQKRRRPRTPSQPVGEIVNIRKRGKRWYAVYAWEGKQNRLSLDTSNEKAARRKAQELESRLRTGAEQARPARYSLEEATRDYEAHSEAKGLAKKSLQRVKLMMRRIRALADARGVTWLDQLDLPFVDAYVIMRRQEYPKLEEKTWENEKCYIKQLTNFALAADKLAVNPLRSLKIRRVRSKPQQCWRPEQVERVLQEVSPDYLPILTALADTGARVGEMRYLTWADVEFDVGETGVIHIRPKDEWKPKSKKPRCIPMQPRLRTLLANLPRRGRWVFTAPGSRTGEQVSDRRVLQHLKSVLPKLGLTGKVHTLRHSFISWALSQRIPRETLKEWVGQIDDATMDLYTHVFDDESQSAMLRLAAAPRSRVPCGDGT